MHCLCGTKRLYISAVVFVLLNMLAVMAQAEEKRLKPFILAENIVAGSVESVAAAVTKKLTLGGFEVVGQYSPYAGTTILAISNPQLREHAAQSSFGAFGAIQRVTIVKTDTEIQLSYTNPTYMAYVYRMKTDLADVSSKLASVLGRKIEYGSEKGLTSDELRNYQYKWLMPYFDNRHELVDYKTQQQALEKVEKILASKAGGVSKVYRVDLPGKEESVIGVSMSGPENNDCSGDQYIMSRIDFKAIKSAGHLPYELVVSKGKVYILFAEFRIAINFPDLSMMGSNSFASIMCAPSAIKTAITKGVGGKDSRDDF